MNHQQRRHGAGFCQGRSRAHTDKSAKEGNGVREEGEVWHGPRNKIPGTRRDPEHTGKCW